MAYTYWISGNSAGPHLFKPGKLLLHTTEGSSIEGAIAAYRAANSWPHTTVDYMFGHPYRICRHLDYDLSGRALRNEAGGVQTNTAGVIQIEVVGAASRPHEIDWVTFAREVVGPLCRAHTIPVVSTLPWVPYPASYGKGAAQRLGGEAWLAYRGILGHQHAPENSHGDPGAIPIADVLRAATLQPPTVRKDDKVYAFVKGNQDPSGTIWLTDLVTKRAMHSMDEYFSFLYVLQKTGAALYVNSSGSTVDSWAQSYVDAIPTAAPEAQLIHFVDNPHGDGVYLVFASSIKLLLDGDVLADHQAHWAYQGYDTGVKHWNTADIDAVPTVGNP